MLQNLRRIGPARCKVVQALERQTIRTSTTLSRVILDRSRLFRPLPHSSLLNNTDINLRYCNNIPEKLDRLKFEQLCSETLTSLADYFEELVESSPHLKNSDVSYSDGVLTVYLGKQHGTYVINRQSPNFQIWLSSPVSGPKRYDFINGTWVYKHDNSTLFALLNKEIKSIVKQDVNFIENCSVNKE